MTDSPAAVSARVHALHDVIVRAVNDGGEAALRTVFDTLLRTCVPERGAVERISQTAADWKDKGDTVRRAVCDGHACGRLIAVERIEEDILGALELADEYERATAGMPDDEPSYLPTVVSQLAEPSPVACEATTGGSQ